MITLIKATVVSLIFILIALNVPASWFSLDQWFGQQRFGAFTDISSTDNLADFPTVYNANLDKTIEVGTTSVVSITTLSGLTSASSLATVGTITTGTWSADVIAVNKNGTGTTSPTSDQVILGNGSSGLKVVNGFGTSGQFLTSNGVSTAPTWQTSAVNQTDSYSWSGNHNFTGSTYIKTLNASSTIVWNGLSLSIPTTQGASSTVLVNNGSGLLSFNTVAAVGAGHFLGATTTDQQVNDTAIETVIGTGTIATILGQTLGTSGAIKGTMQIDTYTDAGADDDAVVRMKLGGTTVCQVTLTPAPSSNIGTYIEFFMYNTSVSTQECISTVRGGTSSKSGDTTSSVNTSIDNIVTFTFDWSDGVDGGSSETAGIGSRTVTVLGHP